LIRAEYAGEQLKNVTVFIDGVVTEYGIDAGSFAMVTIQGERAYPEITLRGVGQGATLNAGGRRRVLAITNHNQVTISDLTLTGGRALNTTGGNQSGSTIVISMNVALNEETRGFGGGGIYGRIGSVLTQKGGALQDNTPQDLLYRRN
jgi:hypothetical protein